MHSVGCDDVKLKMSNRLFHGFVVSCGWKSVCLAINTDCNCSPVKIFAYHSVAKALSVRYKFFSPNCSAVLTKEYDKIPITLSPPKTSVAEVVETSCMLYILCVLISASTVE